MASFTLNTDLVDEYNSFNSQFKIPHFFFFSECHELMNYSNSKYNFQNKLYFATGIHNNQKRVA